MKKVLFMAVIALGALTACQQAAKEGEAGNVNTDTTAVTEESKPEAQQGAAVSAIETAQSLATYGYQNNSPEALIEAANILASTPASELKAEDYKAGTSTEKGEEKAEKAAPSAKQFLADAKAMAGDDANLLALIAKVEEKLNAAAGATRGNSAGAQSTTDRVQAHATDVYTVRFNGGQFAEVAVIGDGDTDLDLYIYDENGNLIDSDTDYTDRCYCSWTPAWTGIFRIKVVNRGNVYNQYVIATN